MVGDGQDSLLLAHPLAHVLELGHSPRTANGKEEIFEQLRVGGALESLEDVCRRIGRVEIVAEL